MKLLRLCPVLVLAAACGAVLAGAPEVPEAPDGASSSAAPRGPNMQERGPGNGNGPDHGPGGRRPGPPAFHGLELDDAQDDKVFAIMHAQAPQRREQSRILRQSQDALRALASSGQYDEGKAAALAKTAGTATAALALMEARTEARILAVMTPEQRSEAAAAKERRHPRFDR